jgi:hypothetical protein
MIKHTAKLTKKKKLVTKVFEMKRADIVVELDNLTDRLYGLDPHDMSANAMEEELGEIRGDVVNLASQITDERF